VSRTSPFATARLRAAVFVHLGAGAEPFFPTQTESTSWPDKSFLPHPLLEDFPSFSLGVLLPLFSHHATWPNFRVRFSLPSPPPETLSSSSRQPSDLVLFIGRWNVHLGPPVCGGKPDRRERDVVAKMFFVSDCPSLRSPKSSAIPALFQLRNRRLYRSPETPPGRDLSIFPVPLSLFDPMFPVFYKSRGIWSHEFLLSIRFPPPVAAHVPCTRQTA